jgi:hypothetical protein
MDKYNILSVSTSGTVLATWNWVRRGQSLDFGLDFAIIWPHNIDIAPGSPFLCLTGGANHICISREDQALMGCPEMG